MAKRLRLGSRKARLFIVLALAVVIGAVAIAAVQWETLPELSEMNIEAPPAAALAIEQGKQWVPAGVDQEGFALAAENERYALLVEPKSSQIIVVNKQNGYRWRSNPTELGSEKVKGALLENLQSPYVLEYVSGTETKRGVSNTKDKTLRVEYISLPDGIQAAYHHEKLAISFVIQYRLTAHGLEVAIPNEGIQENGANKVFALNLLPFFGAVSGIEEDGYLFVPDGPGGLIHYNYKRPLVGYGYEFPIYGDDPANLKMREGFSLREQISYPVFGLKRGEQAFAAIVKEGKYTANIKALPSGLVSTYHSLGASFKYREEFGRKVSGITDQVVNTVTKEHNREDRRVEYRLLSGDEANYVGMARAYRGYLEESKLLSFSLPAKAHIPLKLSLIAGGTKPRFGGNSYVPATTFDQAGQMVSDLKQSGVSDMDVTIQGWQSSGYAYTDEQFPIQESIGGNAGAKAFISSMHELGVTVMFEDYMAWKNPKHSAFTVKSDGIRSLDSTVLQGGNTPGHQRDESKQFIVNPLKAIRKQKATIDKLKEIGADGIHYVDGPGNLLYSDYLPGEQLSRAETSYYYQGLLDYTRQQLGQAGVYRGNDYILSHADFIEELPTESSYDFIVDETVPFYPLVVHGAVAYTAAPANLRSDYEAGLLKAIEYGALPYFKLTYADNRTLKDTDYDYVYSSEYDIWKDRIVKEYRKFDELAPLYHLRMTDHAKLADGQYVTTYEDGTKVTVNYKTNSFEIAKGGAQ
ncbi:DUF5696 domain-containing protein [Paenibacillus sp. GCM10027626]|uniref:DUF5696 domain-containing protein n=1 Tax=Paenibacillus sp. GCM10027626 TaxID=3273411 RepID=UPI00363CF4F6